MMNHKLWFKIKPALLSQPGNLRISKFENRILNGGIRLNRQHRHLEYLDGTFSVGVFEILTAKPWPGQGQVQCGLLRK